MQKIWEKKNRCFSFLLIQQWALVFKMNCFKSLKDKKQTLLMKELITLYNKVSAVKLIALINYINMN